MLPETVRGRYAAAVAEIRTAGLAKEERVLETPQGVRIRVAGREVLNFCANNYLGLANHPRVIEAARAALDRWGYGMASGRFICAPPAAQAELEGPPPRFLGRGDPLLSSSCFDANGGVFEPL